MIDQVKGPDRAEDNLRRLALALVAEAPPAPPLLESGEDGATLVEAAGHAGKPRRRAWPLAAAAALIAIVGLVVAGPILRSSEPVSTTTLAEPPATIAATAAVVATPTDAASFTTPGLSEPGLFLIAKPNDFPGTAVMSVYDEPKGEPRLLVDQNAVLGIDQPFPLTHPTQFTKPLVLRVVEGAAGDAWVKVQAPVRPHGQTVWVPTARFDFAKSDVRVEIDVGYSGSMTVFKADEELFSSPIVSGRPSRPTVLHDTYVEQIMPGSRFGPAYGNWVVSTASFSEVLGSFGSSGGMPGQSIHGTNQPELMGQTVSSGGIRIPDEAMQQLVEVPGLLGAQVLKFNSNSSLASKDVVTSQPWVSAKTAPHTENADVPIIAYS